MSDIPSPLAGAVASSAPSPAPSHWLHHVIWLLVAVFGAGGAGANWLQARSELAQAEARNNACTRELADARMALDRARAEYKALADKPRPSHEATVERTPPSTSPSHGTIGNVTISRSPGSAVGNSSAHYHGSSETGSSETKIRATEAKADPR